MPKSAVGVAVQLVQGTAETTPDFWMRHSEAHTLKWVPAQDIPHYERNQRAVEGDVMPTTLYSTAELNIRVDVRQYGRLLVAAAAYSLVSGKHTYIFGGDISAWLTLWFYEGTTGEMWKMHDVRVDQLEEMEDWTAGTVKAKLTLMGQPHTRITSSLPTISFTTPASSARPFVGKQAVLLRAGAGFCPITATLQIENHLEANYCGPSADPVAGADPYQAPDSIDANEATGRLDLTAKYGAYTASQLEDFRLAREEAYTLTATDPEPTPDNVLKWTFPRFVPVQGDLDPDATKRRTQTVTGPLLLDDATGGLAKLEITNDEATSYLA